MLQASGASSLTQLMELMGDDPRLRLKKPSLSVEGGSKLGDGTDGTIYMRGVLEAHYKKHLDLAISEIFDSGATLVITDPSVPGSVKVIVQFLETPDVDLADAS